MTNPSLDPQVGRYGYGAPSLNVLVRSEGPPAPVIEVRGELDLFTGPLLKQHLEPYNDSNNSLSPRIVYLLPNLDFMDVSGLHALLGAVDGYGPGSITIRQPSASVRRLLELVEMDSMIEEQATI